METRQAQIGMMEKQLQKLGAKLDDLAARVATAGTKTKSDERQLVADLRVKQERARAKLDELKVAGSDKWETFKAGVEGAYNELEDAFKKMAK